MLDPASDAQVTKDLKAIAERLAALASGPPDTELIDTELIAIRAQLRRLAEDNAEVGDRLAVLLGLRQPDPRRPLLDRHSTHTQASAAQHT